MKKDNSSKSIEAEAAFAADLYRDRAALNSGPNTRRSLSS